MTQSTSSTPATTALLEAPQDTSRLVRCPLCHTRHVWLTQEALQIGEGWQCVRCKQLWDARRLATVAAYAAWVAQHESVERKRGSAAKLRAMPTLGHVPENDPTNHGDAISTWDDEGGGTSAPIQ